MIIGLTGSFGSGCTTVATFLEVEQEFRNFSLSDELRKEIESTKKSDFERVDFKERRKLLQDKGDELRRKNPYHLIDCIKDEIHRECENGRNIVIDGIKSQHEVVKMRSEFKDFTLLAINAEVNQRWKRCKKAYDGDRTRFDNDDERDSGVDQPDYGQHVRKCVEIADIYLANDYTWRYRKDWKQFFFKVESSIELLRKPGYRFPFPREMFMAAAYIASLRSKCTRRQVGAIIVSPATGGIVSSGFNEVPPGSKPCRELGGPQYCYRHKAVEEKAKGMKYCPFCGTKLSLRGATPLPFRCRKCLARLPEDIIPGKMLDICRAVHAEEDAILQAANLGSTSLVGCILYSTTFPCLLCAKMIVAVGITRVIYLEPYPMAETSKIFKNAKPEVKTFRYEGVGARAFYSLFKPSGSSN